MGAVPKRAPGAGALVQSQLVTALVEYKRPSPYDARPAEVSYREGNRLAARGDFAAAIANYDAVIGLDPRHADAYKNRGNAGLPGRYGRRHCRLHCGHRA